MEHPAGSIGAASGRAADAIDIAALVEALPLPALVVRLDHTVVACNAAAAALMGLRDGARGVGLLTLGSERAGALVPAIGELKDRLGPNDATLTGVRTDLEWAVVRLRPILNARGAVVGVLVTTDAPATATDGEPARELREAASALSGVKHLLHEVQEPVEARGAGASPGEQKHQFLAMLAHELRNPLSAIVNALHVLRGRTGSDHLAAKAVQIADRQARHQARLLDDLLDASRVVLGKIDLRVLDVDLGTLLAQVIADADYVSRGRAQDVALDAPSEPVVVRGDAARLAQVFRNLLGNALKYTGPGGRIHVKVAAAGAEAVVDVRDSGVGIDADVLPRIFDLFVQADSSLARSQGGLGIGLTLVRHVVRMHGGTVEARSAGRGQGSEFEVRLPLSAAVASAPAPASAEPTEAGARRVLLIEDNRDSRQMLQLLLELKGHRVQEAANGRAGIKLAVEGVPDVVLVDIGLPDMDGYAVAERLRKLLGRGVRLVALTGYGDPHARRRARAAGFDAFLVKPVDPEQLAAAMAATPS